MFIFHKDIVWNRKIHQLKLSQLLGLGSSTLSIKVIVGPRLYFILLRKMVGYIEYRDIPFHTFLHDYHWKCASLSCLLVFTEIHEMKFIIKIFLSENCTILETSFIVILRNVSSDKMRSLLIPQLNLFHKA